MTRKFGVNVVSLWPWSLGPRGPERAIKMAKEAGFDGVQALPMKFWSYKRIKQWEKDVISWEDAWNCGPLWKVPLRHLGFLDAPAPTVVDWAMFGKKTSPIFPDAIASMHHFGDGVSAEIHPELATNHQAYLNHCAQGGMLTWDTYHVTRPHRQTGKHINQWETLLMRIPAENIALIHVHPARNNTEALVQGSSFLIPMLEKLGRKTSDTPVILEVFPPLSTYGGTIEFVGTLNLFLEI